MSRTTRDGRHFPVARVRSVPTAACVPMRRVVAREKKRRPKAPFERGACYWQVILTARIWLPELMFSV